ncbi:hypothetical protein HC766_08590 [Candidatus Gracilibacteria bacterium]|nr:hypothetical protein [Candidatus Gracilibacteria bacterium]
MNIATEKLGNIEYKQLTIFDLILKDHTGKIKVNRYFRGSRFNNTGWQYKLKSQYPINATVAASGLVKQNKYDR